MMRIVEIFSSIQGEGLYAGQKQIFVRFAGCNLACDYCDQPEARPLGAGRDRTPDEAKKEITKLVSADKFQESTPFRRGESLPSVSDRTRNRVSAHQWVAGHLQSGIVKHRSDRPVVLGRCGQRPCGGAGGGPLAAISFTGGEPLLHVEALRVLMPFAGQAGLAVHLETNASLPSAFRQVMDFTDVVAADIKLPSATEKRIWEANRRFLQLCPEKAFVKIVLTAASTEGELETAFKLIEGVSPNIPVFLQPVTPVPSLRRSVDMVKPPRKEFVQRALELAGGVLSKVQVLPQRHPVWGVR
ncbi:MAG: 7-carboxy-7-deazaguanine synthase QueE [bacterium]